MQSTARALTVIFVLYTICLLPTPMFADEAPRRSRASTASMQQLRNELDAMKQQLQQMQETIRKQEQVIQKLSSQPVPTPTAPAVATPREEQFKREVKEDIMRDIKPSLAAANKTFPSQFNPAIGLVLDTAFSSKEKQRANFEFRSAEIGMSASIDPFTRGYAIFNGTPDGIEVEEAAIVTTALPYNLTVKGGRFFADFGRLSKFHDHNLPFVNRPVVLDRFVEGESQADGVEVSYLAPLHQYITLTAGMYNKLGGENERVDNLIPRNFSEFTYLGRAATFFNFTDTSSADLGLSYAYTPKVKIEERGNRHLAGVDLTLRYLPLSQAGYRGLIWGTELLYNHENRPVGGFPDEEDAGNNEDPLQFKRRNAFGLYSYVEARLTRRFYTGFLVDWAQSIDPGIKSTIDYSPYLTIWASEFQRIRLQYTRFEGPGNHENQFFAQWSIALGSHVHGFSDR